MSFADAGKFLSPLEIQYNKLNKNLLPSYLILFQHYLKELDILKKAIVHLYSRPSIAACLCGVNGFAG